MPSFSKEKRKRIPRCWLGSSCVFVPTRIDVSERSMAEELVVKLTILNCTDMDTMVGYLHTRPIDIAMSSTD